MKYLYWRQGFDCNISRLLIKAKTRIVNKWRNFPGLWAECSSRVSMAIWGLHFGSHFRFTFNSYSYPRLFTLNVKLIQHWNSRVFMNNNDFICNKLASLLSWWKIKTDQIVSCSELNKSEPREYSSLSFEI